MSHEGPYGGGHEFHHHPPPHLHGGPPPHEGGGLAAAPQIKGQVVKIFSRAGEKFNLAVRGNVVIVAEANDADPYQQWIKDESWSNKAKDAEGYPAFALINKGTGLALRRPAEVEEKVLQSPYHQNSLDQVVLWSTGRNEGHGYHAIRAVSDIKLNLDIDHGSKKYGGVQDGKAVIVFTWKDEDNQHWQIVPIDESGSGHHHFHI